jgi:acylglycerol lipase
MYAMKDKTIKIYQGLYHEVYNEPKERRDVVLNDLVKWLDSHV